jgi:O-antigen/teichoic acid export membrane protein
LCYSFSLTGLLGLLWVLKNLTFTHVAFVMAASAMFATACFGLDYLKRQFLSPLRASLQNYLATWRDLTRWSLLGVLLTEATANAHAYLVIFISGAQSFALLAIGALFMRPVSLSLSALSDVERPFMARSIAGGNMAKAECSMREFRAVSTVICVAATLFCIAVLAWFPALVLKQNYRIADVAMVAALWSAIMVTRLIRTPASVLLQAAGEFRPLARATYLSSAVSILLTLVLLLAFGPIFSLVGILTGDAVMTAQILRAARKWKRAHG